MKYWHGLGTWVKKRNLENKIFYGGWDVRSPKISLIFNTYSGKIWYISDDVFIIFN